MSEQDLKIQFEEGVQPWEYLTFIIAHTELEPALRTIGREGWELVQGFPCQVGVGEQQQSTIALPDGLAAKPASQGGLMLIFKRPRPGGIGRGAETVQPSAN